MKFLLNYALLDAATPWQLGFQDPATPIIIGIIHFHNHLIFFLVVIGTFVFWLLYKALVLFKEDPSREASQFTHSTPLEVVWTITPALLLLLIAGPSFALLYSMDELIAPHISLKVIGHQWYWSYEYSDYQEPVTGEYIKFDSYIVAEDDLSLGALRLLEVDNRVKLPVNVHIRVLVSSADVLHSWAVPSLGIKIDACPGRLNQVSLFLMRKGVFYGQCSEICGVNHAFIPIVVESLSEESYLNWVKATLPSADSGIGSVSESPSTPSGGDSAPTPSVGNSAPTPPVGNSAPTPKVEPEVMGSDKTTQSDRTADDLSLEWLKDTLLYHREIKKNHDIISEAKSNIEAHCASVCGTNSGDDYHQCLVEFIKVFKSEMTDKNTREIYEFLIDLFANIQEKLNEEKLKGKK